MNWYQRYCRLMSTIEGSVLAIGLAVMLGITFCNIVGRKFLSTSWAFTEEVTCALFLLVTLVGAAMAARRGAHLGLSIVTDLLPKTYQMAIRMFVAAAGLLFSWLMVTNGIEMVMGEIATNMRTPALGWPEWWFGAFVPVGGLFMGLEFINFAIKSLYPEFSSEQIGGQKS